MRDFQRVWYIAEDDRFASLSGNGLNPEDSKVSTAAINPDDCLVFTDPVTSDFTARSFEQLQVQIHAIAARSIRR